MPRRQALPRRIFIRIATIDETADLAEPEGIDRVEINTVGIEGRQGVDAKIVLAQARLG